MAASPDHVPGQEYEYVFYLAVPKKAPGCFVFFVAPAIFLLSGIQLGDRKRKNDADIRTSLAMKLSPRIMAWDTTCWLAPSPA